MSVVKERSNDEYQESAPDDVVILEDRDGEIVFKPAAVLEIESYSEEQIAQWVDEDQLDDQERVRILRAIESRSG